MCEYVEKVFANSSLVAVSYYLNIMNNMNINKWHGGDDCIIIINYGVNHSLIVICEQDNFCGSGY